MEKSERGEDTTVDYGFSCNSKSKVPVPLCFGPVGSRRGPKTRTPLGATADPFKAADKPAIAKTVSSSDNQEHSALVNSMETEQTTEKWNHLEQTRKLEDLQHQRDLYLSRCLRIEALSRDPKGSTSNQTVLDILRPTEDLPSDK